MIRILAVYFRNVQNSIIKIIEELNKTLQDVSQALRLELYSKCLAIQIAISSNNFAI